MRCPVDNDNGGGRCQNQEGIPVCLKGEEMPPIRVCGVHAKTLIRKGSLTLHDGRRLVKSRFSSKGLWARLEEAP